MLRKSLGQHVLVDEIISDRIVGLAEITKNDTVIEIGPGKGALTKWITMSSPKRIVLVELDQFFSTELKGNFPKAEIINQDLCELDLLKVKNTDAEQFIVLGNLPYNVSAKILEHLVQYQYLVPKMVLMFQKEVADKICADVGSSEYGRLSLLAKEFYDTQSMMVLGREYFKPKPKVDSSVLLFTRRKDPIVKISDRVVYNRLVKHVFSNRRKMLRRSLKPLYNAEVLEKAFAETKIDPTKRPQELSIREFATLSNVLS